MDTKSDKFRGTLFGSFLCLPNIAVHPFLDRGYEIFDRFEATFNLELHASVREVFDPPGNVIFSRHVERRIAKADALNPAVKKNRFVVNFRHRGEGNSYRPWPAFFNLQSHVCHELAGLLRCIPGRPEHRETYVPA